MREIRIEVCNESEAIEFCDSMGYEYIKVYEGRGNNSGKLMMLAIDRNSSDTNYDEQYIEEKVPAKPEIENTVIFTIVNGGRMYVADKSKCSQYTTFQSWQAKLFTKSAAEKRVKYMNKHGTYDWKTLCIK